VRSLVAARSQPAMDTATDKVTVGGFRNLQRAGGKTALFFTEERGIYCFRNDE